jgi:hypothetical protein
MNIQVDSVEPTRVKQAEDGLIRLFGQLAEFHEEYEGWVEIEDVMQDLLQDILLVLVCDYLHLLIY